MGVQVMALPHAEGSCEVGCNLQASQDRDSPALDDVLAFVSGRLPAGARVARSYVIGLTPGEALASAERALGADASDLRARPG